MERKLYPLNIDYANKRWTLHKTYDELIYFLSKLSSSVKKLSPWALQVPGLSPADFNFTSALKALNSSLDQADLLDDLLKNLFKVPELESQVYIREFIEFSALSSEQNSKKKEGYIFKRTGGHHANEARCMNVCKYCRRVQKRWLVLTDDFVGYTTKSTDNRLHEVLMFKDDLKIYADEKITEYPDGVIIETTRRRFFFHAGSTQKKKEWVEAISEGLSNSRWGIEKNDYNSTYPLRANNSAKWYVDGEDYFADVYNYLLKAQQQVFITDWWLSPEMFLIRPASEHPESQVVEVLKSLAEKGVKIFVHMYKEVTLACTFDSLHSKEVLKRNIKKNIQIIRHPQRNLLGGSMFWSHHEKICCIDEQVAFLGGLDLCFGRFDNSAHKLVDTDPARRIWNGIDYANNRIRDFVNVRDYETTQIDRETQPRMPWHDIGLRVQGPVARDVAYHFIDLWNHVMTDLTGHYHRNKDLLRSSAVMTSPVTAKPPENFTPGLNSLIKKTTEKKDTENRETENLEGPEDLNSDSQHQKNFELMTPVFKAQRSGSYKEFSYKDLQAKMKADSTKKSNKLQMDQRKTLQHGNLKIFSNLIKNTLAEDPLSKVKQQTDESLKKHKEEKKEEEKEDEKEEAEMKRQMDKDGGEGGLNFLLTPLVSSLFKVVNEESSFKCQVLRSASQWSYGLNETEASIHMAYLSLIENSRHFIYIENQFFISSTAGGPVSNQIAAALVNRIIKARDRNEKFQVFVLMPLLPGFEGNVYDPSAAVLKIQLNWEYKTINRSEHSLFKRLEAENINPHDYINFYGLRNRDLLNGVPVTEIVYIHSKLMIVDDDIVIVGSANINDRSMIGSHDSEIDMVVEDTKKIEAKMNGQPHNCSKFAHELRKKLFREFLADEQADVEDPLDTGFLKAWKNTAKKNTEAYRTVFQCYPDNVFATMEDIILSEKLKFTGIELLNAYFNHFEGLKGLLVEFPLEFLRDEDLSFAFFSKENLLPEESFI